MLKANIILLIAAIIWGCAFGFQRKASFELSTNAIIALRFSIAALAILPFYLLRKKNENELSLNSPKLIIGTLCAGIVLYMACAFQQWGLESTTAGKAGFITGMYVVMIPIIGIFIGKKTNAGTWTGVILATYGLYLLSVKEDFSFESGDLKVLVCAFICAIYGHIIGWLAPKCNPLDIAFWQYTISAVLGCITLVSMDSIPSMDKVMNQATAILYLGIISTALGFTLQVIGQKTVNPTHAAIILSLETVFAALAGYLMLNELLSLKAFIGCTFMLCGMIVAQLWEHKALKKVSTETQA
jgi:drug/metabolite transporter (DMT)-like permease